MNINLTEIIFIIGFLVCIGITFLKLYNIMKLGSIYDWTWIIILFIGFLLAYLMMIVGNMFLASAFVATLTILVSYLLPLQVLFLIGELFFYFTADYIN